MATPSEILKFEKTTRAFNAALKLALLSDKDLLATLMVLGFSESCKVNVSLIPKEALDWDEDSTAANIAFKMTGDVAGQ